MATFRDARVSLQNLGKMKEVLGILDSVGDAAEDIKAIDGVKDFIGDLLGGMSVNNAANALKNLKVDIADIPRLLEAMDYPADKAAEAVKALGKSAGTSTSLFGKLKTAFTGLATKLGMSAAALGGWIAAAVGIYAVIKIINHFATASERAAEELAKLEEEYDELQDKISNTASEFKNLRTSAESVIPRFAELAKGVNALGKNVSLTDEEYNEFLSLNNQIAEMFPELNLGMDSNGNAMLSLSYTADTLAESLWNVVEAERAAAYQETADSMPGVLENIEGQVDIYRDKIGELSETQSEYFDTYSNFLNRSLPTNIGNFSTLESGLAAAEEFIKIANELGIHGAVSYDNNTSTNNGYAFSVEWDYYKVYYKLRGTG